MTPAFCEAAIYCYKHAWRVPSILYACNEIDDLLGFKSPWDSIYKLRTLVSRCKTIPVDAEWCVIAINDGVVNHTLPSLPISHLKDLPGTSGRSIVDVLLLQRSVRDHGFEVLSFKLACLKSLAEQCTRYVRHLRRTGHRALPPPTTLGEQR